MKTRGVFRGGLRACAALAVAAGAAQADVVWHRASDWVPGTVQGGSTNNPGPANGAPAWRYVSAQGGGLGSANPWYAQTGNLMTWDSGWYSTGWGVWSKGDDLNPPILPGRLVHNVHPTTWADIPMVQFLNPYAAPTNFDITGTLTVNWNGVNGLGRPVNVDVVIAKHIAATNTTTLLYSNTVSKPNPFPSVGDSVFLPVSLLQVSLAAGDSLIISQRGQNSVGPLGAWVNLYDDLNLSTIPTPAGLSLLGLAGLAAARRRR
jgi:hypothetical protein